MVNLDVLHLTQSDTLLKMFTQMTCSVSTSFAESGTLHSSVGSVCVYMYSMFCVFMLMSVCGETVTY